MPEADVIRVEADIADIDHFFFQGAAAGDALADRDLQTDQFLGKLFAGGLEHQVVAADFQNGAGVVVQALAGFGHDRGEKLLGLDDGDQFHADVLEQLHLGEHLGVVQGHADLVAQDLHELNIVAVESVLAHALDVEHPQDGVMEDDRNIQFRAENTVAQVDVKIAAG